MAQLAEILAKMAEESMLEQQEVTLLQASIRAGHARVIGLMELVGDDTALEEETLTAIRDEAATIAFAYFMQIMMHSPLDHFAEPDERHAAALSEFLAFRLLISRMRPIHCPTFFDLSCGRGGRVFNTCMSGAFTRVVGVDSDAESIERAKSTLRHFNSAHRAAVGAQEVAVEFMVGDALTADWSDAGLAIVDCRDMEEDALRRLGEVTARLAPGSALICLGTPVMGEELHLVASERVPVGGEEVAAFLVMRVSPAIAARGAAAAAAAASNPPSPVREPSPTVTSPPRSPPRVRLPSLDVEQPGGGEEAAAGSVGAGSVPASPGALMQELASPSQRRVWSRLAAVRTESGRAPSSPQGAALLSRKKRHRPATAEGPREMSSSLGRTASDDLESGEIDEDRDSPSGEDDVAVEEGEVEEASMESGAGAAQYGAEEDAAVEASAGDGHAAAASNAAGISEFSCEPRTPARASGPSELHLPAGSSPAHQRLRAAATADAVSGAQASSPQGTLLLARKRHQRT